MRPWDEFLTLDFYRPALANSLRIGFIMIVAGVAIFLVGRVIQALRKYALKAMLKAESGPPYELEKRANTVADVVRKSMVIFIWAIALIMVLRELSFDVRPLLAGAGIVGVAVGLGAQSLVRDVLGGFFLLLENQIRVNDVAVINGTGGLVEEINLRTTVLRSEDGAVHVFPNGSISKLANMTRDFSYCVFTVTVDIREDPDDVVATVIQVGSELATEEPYRSVILAPLEMWGVDQIGNGGFVIKARFKTVPMKQWMVSRELNRRIKLRFSEVGIAFPMATQMVGVGQAVKAEDRTQEREDRRQKTEDRS